MNLSISNKNSLIGYHFQHCKVSTYITTSQQSISIDHQSEPQFEESNTNLLNYVCNINCGPVQNPTQEEIGSAISELQAMFPHLQMLSLSHRLYKEAFQSMRAYQFPRQKTTRQNQQMNPVRIKRAKRPYHKKPNGIADQMQKVKIINRTPINIEKDNDYRNIAQKGYNNASLNQITNPIMKRSGGRKWDDRGKRIKGNPDDINDNQTVVNTPGRGKITDSDHLLPINVKCKILRPDNKKIILTNKGLIPQKPTLIKRYHMINNRKDCRIIERQVAAKSFCDRGYGIPRLRQELKECKVPIKIDDKRYKAVSTALVSEAFRIMQKFLKVDCNLNIKIASTTQVKVLYTILLNCRDNFLEEEARTFVKFVKLTFELGEVEINQDETIKLYNRFMTSMQEKIKLHKFDASKGTFEPLKQSKAVSMVSSKPSDQYLWTRQREKQFCEIYFQQMTLRGVRNYFREKYSPQRLKQEGVVQPQLGVDYDGSFYKAITDMKELASKFRKVMRSGLRRIQVYSNRHQNMPALRKMTDELIKRMFSSFDGVQARKMVLKIQKMDELQPEIVCEAVHLINQFMEAESRRRAEGVTYSQEQMNS